MNKMKLVKLAKSTYVIEDINKIGIYLINDSEVAIIDTGISDLSGNEIMKICEEQGWQIKMVLVTHAHPDHIGGNYIIAKTLKVPIYAYGIEQVICNYPQLMSSITSGGFSHKYARNPYLRATDTLPLTDDILPDGIEFCLLPGHNTDMVGFKTKDDIYFLGDAIAGKSVISKYQMQFTFDLKAYFKTLDFIGKLDGKFFVPSHGETTEDIKALVSLNKEIILGVIDKIRDICKKPQSYDEVLKEITDFYHIKLDFVQYSIMGCNIRCYLAYMLDEGMIKAEFIDNKLIWETT